MNNPEKLAAQYHNPELKNNSNVIQIWGDGEITYTKGGELFGQRSLHRICRPIPGAEEFLFKTKFPVVTADNSYAIVGTDAQAHEIRNIIIDRVCERLQRFKNLEY